MWNFTWHVREEVKEVSLALFTGGGRIYVGHSSSGLLMENALCLLPSVTFSVLGWFVAVALQDCLTVQ